MQAGEYRGEPNGATRRVVTARPDGGKAAADAGVSHAFQTEARALRQLGFSKPFIKSMARRAHANGSTIEQELLAEGSVDEQTYYAAIARLLGLPFLEEISPDQVMDRPALDVLLQRPTLLRLHSPDKAPLTAIAPEARHLADLAERFVHHPTLRAALTVASASSIRRAVWQAGAARRVATVSNALFEETPQHSARIVMTGRQGFVAGAFLTGGVAALLLASGPVALALHVLLSSLYFAAMVLRLGALFHPRGRDILPEALIADGPLPIYSILVALYREAPIAGQLIAALERLDWPPSRLDIKLVCEADDHETIEAIRKLRPGSHMEIVVVPPGGPRTKPKALLYALAGTRGDYLAIYDAEDRPHPGQLKEAYARFQTAAPEVTCLQAPLIITNMRESCISTVFALEYAALFRGLLPLLARYRMPLPLGGTSNHFRTAALRAAGGWDPYNVTEDADLGMRLYRLGYRSETIRRHTFEDAPIRARVWLGQRTRWFKGWLQTWLVVMRDPGRARREMGTGAFVVFQLLIGGMLVSSLGHPAILVFFTTSAIAMLQSPAEHIHPLKNLLFGIDAMNIFGSYSIFLGLGVSAMIEYERRLLGWRWLAIPVYWMMVSYAAWRAAFELRERPFFWNKTPHEPRPVTMPAATPPPAAADCTGVNPESGQA
ncbi:cellulose synthase/poly-beta-1,6-N-acetylglucosamine synthase-like glycosyltransferase [Ciceribacter lividus]|uniref:Cellulose synthase/poly-beta-1,6-N-acetylglucosamine synthase-like glycosyltransferase n=1 Tax=Ciceribacter lividus TaxID=1197950 RepID=A0A6I7HNB0_9HYPH|nr:glycosyltransferase family 2 protein [Ciceribacter lividus]RCW27172.1 cellulose synthase/poly-beta-1,6-N-acetylglucosamine synthase-like glycosyltransferase [Ciceribacter lividus]